MKSTLIVTALIALTAISTFAQNGRPRPSPSPTPVVTATFRYCAAVDTVCQSEARVRADVDRPYTNGQEGVKIEFYDGGSKDLIIRLDSSTRTVAFDLRDFMTPVAGSIPTWTNQVQNLKPMMNVLGALIVRDSTYCPNPSAGCTFDARMNSALGGVGGVKNTTYALLWNPRTLASNNRPVNDPWQTSDVLVHYVKNPDNGEELFTISAQQNGCLKLADGTCSDVPKDFVAGLEQTAGRTVSAAGQYRMPFTFTVKIKPPTP